MQTMHVHETGHGTTHARAQTRTPAEAQPQHEPLISQSHPYPQLLRDSYVGCSELLPPPKLALICGIISSRTVFSINLTINVTQRRVRQLLNNPHCSESWRVARQDCN